MQLISLAGIGALNGAFGASLADLGIDDNFIKQTKDKVTEGTSALFLLTSDATTDKVAEQMKKLDFEIISTSLSQGEEDPLKAEFSED